jgi:hypothetical protein
MDTLTPIQQPNEQSVKKRKADETLNLAVDDNSDSFSRFLVVTANNLEPIPYNIFAIQKLLKCAVGDVPSAKKLANGSVLVEVASRQQERNTLKMNTWIDTPISVSPHRSLNSCRGVIRCREFRDCDDTEVLDALRDQGVTFVKHIISKRNGITSPTNTFIITINKPTLPKFIKAAYMKIAVEPYIPNPLRCFNCQKFGHGKSNCKHQAVCAKCGQEGHDDVSCKHPPHCVNCSGAHASYSRDCPTWTKQRAITTIKFEKNISFYEAKQIVDKQENAGAKRPGVSYAKALSTQTCSAATQTDLTWPLDSKMPVLVADVATKKGPSSCYAQTEPDDSISGAVGGLPAASSSTTNKSIPIKPNTTSLKTGIVGQKPGPSSSKKTTPVSPSKLTNRPAKGTGDIVKLANKYSSLNEMAMDLGGISNTSPNKTKHK